MYAHGKYYQNEHVSSLMPFLTGWDTRPSMLTACLRTEVQVQAALYLLLQGVLDLLKRDEEVVLPLYEPSPLVSAQLYFHTADGHKLPCSVFVS